MATYIINEYRIRPILKKTPYELFNEKAPNISSLKAFRSNWHILIMISIIPASLILQVRKVYLWDTHPKARLTNFTIKALNYLRKHSRNLWKNNDGYINSFYFQEFQLSGKVDVEKEKKIPSMIP